MRLLRLCSIVFLGGLSAHAQDSGVYLYNPSLTVEGTSAVLEISSTYGRGVGVDLYRFLPEETLLVEGIDADYDEVSRKMNGPTTRLVYTGLPENGEFRFSIYALAEDRRGTVENSRLDLRFMTEEAVTEVDIDVSEVMPLSVAEGTLLITPNSSDLTVHVEYIEKGSTPGFQRWNFDHGGIIPNHGFRLQKGVQRAFRSGMLEENKDYEAIVHIYNPYEKKDVSVTRDFRTDYVFKFVDPIDLEVMPAPYNSTLKWKASKKVASYSLVATFYRENGSALPNPHAFLNLPALEETGETAATINFPLAKVTKERAAKNASLKLTLIDMHGDELTVELMTSYKIPSSTAIGDDISGIEDSQSSITSKSSSTELDSSDEDLLEKLQEIAKAFEGRNSNLTTRLNRNSVKQFLGALLDVGIGIIGVL